MFSYTLYGVPVQSITAVRKQNTIRVEPFPPLAKQASPYPMPSAPARRKCDGLAEPEPATVASEPREATAAAQAAPIHGTRENIQFLGLWPVMASLDRTGRQAAQPSSGKPGHQQEEPLWVGGLGEMPPNPSTVPGDPLIWRIAAGALSVE